MTKQETIVWSQLLKNPFVTAEHANDSNRILAATEILQQTARQFANVLNERARLLANSAQFEAALRDAAAIRTILPESGLGYLCTGDVYCQQGRYAAAIAIFDQGLVAVPDSDPYYHHLQQHRIIAATNNKKRVDFITKLPLDIVITNILPRMELVFYSETKNTTYKRYCEFLSVSRAWQMTMLKQPKGLRFDFGSKGMTEGHDQLVRFAPHVQRLDGFIGDARLSDLFSRATFSNLKQLVLQCGYDIPRDALIQGLEMIAGSLTHLTLSECYWNSLHDILNACPNLVSLKAIEVGTGLPSSSSSCYPKMTHLALVYTPDPDFLHDDQTLDFISGFPSLLSLEIYPMRDAKLLTVLHKLCPSLQILYYGVTKEHVAKLDVQPTQEGLTLAYISGDGMYQQHDLIQFFYLHQKSLEEIYCDVSIMESEDAPWGLSNGRVTQCRYRRRQRASLNPKEDPTQSETSFERLVNINFLGYDPSTSEAFNTWFISNAPNLKSINFMDICLRPNIANAMIKSKSLSTLKIACPDRNENVDGVKQFLTHHVAMGNQSTLEELEINLGKETSEAFLHIPYQ
ncbi:hypothetical protein LRAMOSA09013 [Lichtheimia ramosa]|uniref:Uncharacterized protein n=1 Tax=Lichtheimia ramosa TaxID=688394 RepID=A0A077WGJ7_9FUNG|nr:hypothetical protein LRAMOSA09013 [Lichtheimia ramosa]